MSREKTLEFFHNLPDSKAEQFNQACALYRACPNKNTGTERQLNASGHTPHTLSVVLYELQKIYSITDLEKIPPVVNEVAKEDIVIGSDQDAGENPVPGTIVLENATSIKIEEGDFNGNTAITERTAPEPSQTPETPKFREEYPFLKDPDCPAELKILATDKITAYNAYKEAHGTIQKAEAGEITLTPADNLALAADATRLFAESEAIKAELDHYGEHKKLLGKHPLFFKLATEREVEEMTNDECLKFVSSTKTEVSRANKKINEAASDEAKAKVQEKLDKRLAKLALVKKKLGLTE